MIYTFQSKASGNVIYLEGPGRQVLAAMGKDSDAKGILKVAQMPAALAGLEAKAAQDDADRAEQKAKGMSLDGVSFRMRAAPMVAMVKTAQKADVDIVWGV